MYKGMTNDESDEYKRNKNKLENQKFDSPHKSFYYSINLIFSLSAFFCVKSASVCERRFNLLILDHGAIVFTE